MKKTASRRILRELIMFGLPGLGMICLLGGCGQSDKVDTGAERVTPKYEVAEPGEEEGTPDKPAGDDDRRGNVPAGGGLTTPPGRGDGSDSAVPTQPPPVSVDQLESIAVPDGTPQELLDFSRQTGSKIATLQREAQGRVDEAAKTQVIESLRAIISASDKVLGSSEATAEQRKEAIGNEAGAMMYLSQLQPEVDWGQKAREFAASLAADEDPAIAIEGKSILFGLSLGEFAQQENRDVNAIMDQLRALLQDPARTGGVMGISLQAMNMLSSLGHDDQAREALDLIVAAFKDSEDPGVAAEANRLVEQGLFLDAEMEPKFNAVVANRPNSEGVFFDQLESILAQPTTGSLTLEKVAQYINVLQQTGQYETARKLCQLLKEGFANNPDEELRKQADDFVQMALRRLDLIGKTLVVDGPRVNGEALDFSRYQGKTVLLVFFRASSPGSQQELMNVKNAYEKYHERGFDVIGVSVSSDPEALNQLISRAQFPWATITNQDLAEQCGANMLPFGVLLDETGKVTDVFIQGQTLGNKLQAMFGLGQDANLPAVKLPAFKQSTTKQPIPNQGTEQPAAATPSAESEATDEASSRRDSPK